MIYLLRDDVSGRVYRAPIGLSAQNDKEKPRRGPDEQFYRGVSFDHSFPDDLPENYINDIQSRTIVFDGPLDKLVEVPLGETAGYFIVDERFKNIVESLEPDTHSFVELPLWSKVDQAYSGRSCSKVSGLLPENWVVYEGQYEGHHLWRDDICTMSFFVSQELRDALKAKKIRGLEFLQTTQVQNPIKK